jgi:hypothetical protein
MKSSDKLYTLPLYGYIMKDCSVLSPWVHEYRVFFRGVNRLAIYSYAIITYSSI